MEKKLFIEKKKKMTTGSKFSFFFVKKKADDTENRIDNRNSVENTVLNVFVTIIFIYYSSLVSS